MARQRRSRQRELIYQAVAASREHPTAQMVYDVLRPQMPRLSLGTVYRNLHQMAQEGRLVELAGPVSRFDAVLAPHAHLLCSGCGRVVDSAAPDCVPLPGAAPPPGWSVTGYHLLFVGTCPACAQADRSHPSYQS